MPCSGVNGDATPQPETNQQPLEGEFCDGKIDHMPGL